MKVIAVALAVLAAGTLRASAQSLQTGNDLKEACGIADRGPTTSSEALRAGLCHGFVRAFEVIGSSLERPIRYCIPKDVTLGQAEAVLLKYLNDNPANLHQRAELLLISAFRAVWRCK